jgi:hypothetical protein
MYMRKALATVFSTCYLLVEGDTKIHCFLRECLVRLMVVRRQGILNFPSLSSGFWHHDFTTVKPRCSLQRARLYVFMSRKYRYRPRKEQDEVQVPRKRNLYIGFKLPQRFSLSTYTRTAQKHRIQQFSCCVCMLCRGNVFTGISLHSAIPAYNHYVKFSPL